MTLNITMQIENNLCVKFKAESEDVKETGPQQPSLEVEPWWSNHILSAVFVVMVNDVKLNLTAVLSGLYVFTLLVALVIAQTFVLVDLVGGAIHLAAHVHNPHLPWFCDSEMSTLSVAVTSSRLGPEMEAINGYFGRTFQTLQHFWTHNRFWTTVLHVVKSPSSWITPPRTILMPSLFPYNPGFVYPDLRLGAMGGLGNMNISELCRQDRQQGLLFMPLLP